MYTWGMTTSTQPSYSPMGTTGCVGTADYVSTSAKVNIDGEEFSGKDIKFIHELQNLGNGNYDCVSVIQHMMNKLTPNPKYNNKIKYEKEENQKMNLMKNFNFGPCGDRAKLSHLGIAIQNTNGEWVSYDKENNEIVNVDLINFGCNNFTYMIPVAIKDVAEGDTIIHNHHVMFVTKARSKAISVIDVTDGEIKKILPTKSIFGFDFITKIVSLIDFTASTANEDNPFGDVFPFLLLGNNNNKDNDVLPLVLMLMNKNNQECGGFLSSFGSSQMALLAMMNQNKDSNILPLMFLMNQNTK